MKLSLATLATLIGLLVPAHVFAFQASPGLTLFTESADSTWDESILLVEQTPAGHILTYRTLRYKTEFGGKDFRILEVRTVEGAPVCMSKTQVGATMTTISGVLKRRIGDRLMIAGSIRYFDESNRSNYNRAYVGEIQMDQCEITVSRIYDGGTNFNSIAPTSDGGWVLAGDFMCEGDFASCGYNPNYTYSELEVYDRRGEGGLVKLDASLNVEWAHVVYPAVTNGTAYQDALEVEPGTYMVIGTTAAPVGRLTTVDRYSAYAVSIQPTGENAVMRSEITSSFVWQSNCPLVTNRTESWQYGRYAFKWWGNSVHLLTQQLYDCDSRNDQLGNATLDGTSAFPTSRVRGWIAAAVASTRPSEYLYAVNESFFIENGSGSIVKYGKSLSVPNAGTSLTVNSPSMCVGCTSMQTSDIAQTDFGAVVAINAQINGRTISGFILDVDSSLASTSNEDEGFASRLRLEQNYPNPFNPSTLIRFSLDQPSDVVVDVFSSTGQHVARLAEGIRTAGEHRLDFDGGGLASGVYLLRLTTPSYVETRKMTLIK